MQRSKQQALMFLLGALLVGGVLGFSAEKVFGHYGKDTKETRGTWGVRQWMYDDLGLTGAQRVAVDSLIDDAGRQIQALWAPVRPKADSIRAANREAILAVLTPEQRHKYEEAERIQKERAEARERERRQRREADRAQLDSIRRAKE